jgi:hypothetical protein
MKMKYLIPILALSVALTACEKDDNEVTTPTPEENEEELITSLEVHLYRLDGTGDTSVFAFRDLDGAGGAEPVGFDTIFIQNNTAYGCFLKVLNESSNPAEDITLEIEEENTDHLFCFSAVGVALTVDRTDTDGTFEVGLESAWSAGAAGSGSLLIELKHQPGIKDGTCEPGETDIAVEFPVTIQ